MDLVDAGTAAVLATYEYGPFGNTLVAPGPPADTNPIRLSTKYAEAARRPGSAAGPDLYYYGRRYYSPGIGRWASRDPAEERRGGTNLHAFVRNAVTVRCDYLGMWPWTGCCNGLPYNRITHCCCQNVIATVAASGGGKCTVVP